MTSESGEPAEWMAITELARHRGVDKSAISRRVKRFEAQGLMTTRRGPGGTKLVSRAEFDRLTGLTVDAVREMNGRGGSAPPAGGASGTGGLPGDPILSREQARRAHYEAETKRLDLEVRLGKLVPVEQVLDAMTSCGQSIARAINQLHTRSEEQAAAVAKGGVAGLRALNKTIQRELCEELARALTLLSAGAEGEPPPAAPDAEAA